MPNEKEKEWQHLIRNNAIWVSSGHNSIQHCRDAVHRRIYTENAMELKEHGIETNTPQNGVQQKFRHFAWMSLTLETSTEPKKAILVSNRPHLK